MNILMGEGGVSIEKLSMSKEDKGPDDNFNSTTQSASENSDMDPRQAYSNFVHFVGGGTENALELSSALRGVQDSQEGTAPPKREPITITKNGEDQDELAQYVNFSEQFTQGQTLLEESPGESVCLSLVHKEPDPRNSAATIDFVTFHQMRKTSDGAYVLQQIPAVHKILKKIGQMIELNTINTKGSTGPTDTAEETFLNILREGFVPGGYGARGEKNVILYPEDERLYFEETQIGDSKNEADDYYVELWSSYIAYDPESTLGKEMLAPRLFDYKEQKDHLSLYSLVALTPPKDIRGVIVLAGDISPEVVEQKRQDYQTKYPNQEFTFLQRRNSETIPVADE